MGIRTLLATAAGGLTLSACTTEDLMAFNAAMEQANYDMQYGAYGSPYNTYPTTSAYNSYPYGGFYSPNTFSTYGGWPTGLSYGNWVGVLSCRHSGSFYSCDTDGNGYADMFGNADDGSYSSSSLRVNGRGEAFTWGSDCGCWERNRAYDGPRDPDYHYHRDRRDHHKRKKDRW